MNVQKAKKIVTNKKPIWLILLTAKGGGYGVCCYCCFTVKIEYYKFNFHNLYRPPRDPYYDQDTEDRDLRIEADKKKDKQRKTYIKRVIVHPAFHNISYAEAEKCMVNMDQGEVIVRPSSKGADHLTITWKVSDGIYQHIDIREEGKANAFSLGE